MATIGYAELPVPGGGDAPQWPGALAALATAVDGHLVQHAANQADRDSLYADAPLHTVVTADDSTVWIKTSSTSNSWGTVYEPPGPWKSITLADGVMSVGGETAEYRIVGKRAYMRGRVGRVDENPWHGAGTVIAPTPLEARPAQRATWAGGQSMTGDPVTGVCRIECGTAIVWHSQDGASGGIWVDISGNYWLD
ncbi:hypothetical protein [Streptomyces sp. NPDC102283]|uniref:hypothetical protein n=1 Tax=Streptomyces sp. NPDC102283 TaxID=3366155 RepID=UPI0037FC81BD